MTPLLITAINVLTFLIVWRYAVRPAIRDLVRGRLFCLRDQLRKDAARDEWLDRPAYKFIRDSLNHQIRFIENESVLKTMVFGGALTKNEKLRNYLERQHAEITRNWTEQEKQALNICRDKSSFFVKFYMIHTSITLSFCLYSYVIYCATKAVFKRAVQPRSVWYTVRMGMKTWLDRLLDTESIETMPEGSVLARARVA